MGGYDEKQRGAEMEAIQSGTAAAGALVLFGVTGDLARKKIFPALYAMAASVLFVCTKGRMNFACNSTALWPSEPILRAHQCALPHASRATRPPAAGRET